MNRIDLFKRTVDVLYKAYQHNHLQHITSCGCAVGNLVCNALEPHRFKEVQLSGNEQDREVFFAQQFMSVHSAWWAQILYERTGLPPDFVDANTLARGYDEIKATGYTRSELSSIEWAFENAGRMNDRMGLEEKRSMDPDGLIGLLSVINMLGDIHEAPETAQCLMEAVATGTYEYETEEFQNSGEL